MELTALEIREIEMITPGTFTKLEHSSALGFNADEAMMWNEQLPYAEQYTEEEIEDISSYEQEKQTDYFFGTIFHKTTKVSAKNSYKSWHHYSDGCPWQQLRNGSLTCNGNIDGEGEYAPCVEEECALYHFVKIMLSNNEQE